MIRVNSRLKLRQEDEAQRKIILHLASAGKLCVYSLNMPRTLGLIPGKFSGMRFMRSVILFQGIRIFF